MLNRVFERAIEPICVMKRMVNIYQGREMLASAIIDLQACEGVQRGDVCLDGLASWQFSCMFRMLPRRHTPRCELYAWSWLEAGLAWGWWWLGVEVGLGCMAVELGVGCILGWLEVLGILLRNLHRWCCRWWLERSHHCPRGQPCNCKEEIESISQKSRDFLIKMNS